MSFFKEECRQDPEFRKQVLGRDSLLAKEVMSVSDLQVAVSEKSAVLLGTSPGKFVASQAVKTQLRAKVQDAFVTNKRDLADGIVGVRLRLHVRVMGIKK